MMPRRSRAVITQRHRAVIVRVHIERAIRGPASEHVSVGMIERIGTGLLYRSLCEYRRYEGRHENCGHNGWKEFCHDEHPLIGGTSPIWVLQGESGWTWRSDHRDLRNCTRRSERERPLLFASPGPSAARVLRGLSPFYFAWGCFRDFWVSALRCTASGDTRSLML